jgi:hypothetical protein
MELLGTRANWSGSSAGSSSTAGAATGGYIGSQVSVRSRGIGLTQSQRSSSSLV